MSIIQILLVVIIMIAAFVIGGNAREKAMLQIHIAHGEAEKRFYKDLDDIRQLKSENENENPKIEDYIRILSRNNADMFNVLWNVDTTMYMNGTYLDAPIKTRIKLGIYLSVVWSDYCELLRKRGHFSNHAIENLNQMLMLEFRKEKQ